MDENLLHTRHGRAGGETFTENNEPPVPTELESAVDLHEEEQAFREVQPLPAQPPLRMKLDPPVEYDGKTYTEIVCDFDKLIGADFIRAEREFRHQFKPAVKNEIPFAQMNPDYHVIIISRASDLPQGLIKKLPGRYFNTLQSEALKACGSSAEEPNP